MDLGQAAGLVLAPLASAVIGALFGSLRESRKRAAEADEARDAEHRALCLGMRELMRSELYGMHRRYVVDGEPMPYEEKEHEESVYSVYHALGGNGTGTHVHEELEAAYVGGRQEV